MIRREATQFLKRELSDTVQAIYAYGSRVSGEASNKSDLDLAVLLDGCIDPVSLWEVGQQLAARLGCDVDLVDLRSASTVMQYQIITTGECWWARDVQAPLFETFVLNQKTSLDEARAGLLADIQRDGRVYGR